MAVSSLGEIGTAPLLFHMPPRNVELHHSEVHIWRAFLDDAAWQCASFVDLLSDGERERSRCFVLERMRERYIVGHGILRRIVSRYTGIPPGKIGFSYGPQEKPSLSAELNIDRLSFNVSQSAGCALYAFTRGREVGIDVERIREVPEMQGVVSMFFSKSNRLRSHLCHQERKGRIFPCLDAQRGPGKSSRRRSFYSLQQLRCVNRARRTGSPTASERSFRVRSSLDNCRCVSFRRILGIGRL